MSIIELKNKNLSKIKIERKKLEAYLQNGFITEDDIINIMEANSYYGVKATKNYKKEILKNVFNCPFLLCDQKNISENIKELLPNFLQSRYDMEISELEFMYDNADITQEEYDIQKTLIDFCYYESSDDGRKILNDTFNQKQKTLK